MRCQVCGAALRAVNTNLPFKLRGTTIIILKGLPVLECANCAEFLIEDSVMRRVDTILKQVDAAAELEIVGYAA